MSRWAILTKDIHLIQDSYNTLSVQLPELISLFKNKLNWFYRFKFNLAYAQSTSRKETLTLYLFRKLLLVGQSQSLYLVGLNDEFTK